MEFAVELHFVVAFLVAICALAFSWNSRGRRVMNVVLGVQTLLGIVVAGLHVVSHEPLPPSVWWHVGAALVALAAYGTARRLGDRPNGAAAATALSLLGIVAVAASMVLGVRVAGLH
jgi:hypothetical protein